MIVSFAGEKGGSGFRRYSSRSSQDNAISLLEESARDSTPIEGNNSTTWRIDPRHLTPSQRQKSYRGETPKVQVIKSK